MLRWLKRLVAPPQPAPIKQVPVAAKSPEVPSSVERESVPSSSDLHVSTLSWLLHVPPPLPLALQSRERRPWAVIHEASRQPRLPPNLVPRAAAVIPALLQQLRQTDVSVQDMVVRIQRDTVLTTEVLRLARSPRYASAQSVQSLETAIAVIGTAGLQAAIAKVILKPLFSAHSGGLAAQAGERLWMHAEHQAQHASTLTEAAGLDRFDGFLVGLLHGAGRTGVLRLLDMQHVAPEWPCSQAFDHAFQQASHQLFDRLLQEWAISPSLTALGQAIASQPSAAEPGTLAGIALESERLATAALLSTH